MFPPSICKDLASARHAIFGGHWWLLDRFGLGCNGPSKSRIGRRLRTGREPLTGRRLRSNLPRGGYTSHGRAWQAKDMLMMTNNSIDVDNLKDFLDAHRLRNGAVACFHNAPAGFGALSTWLGDDVPTRFLFEATGAYHRDFERAFSGKVTAGKGQSLAGGSVRSGPRDQG
jgi:hypothetical protein